MSRRKTFCQNCGLLIDKDTLALNKKLFTEQAEKFFCLSCLAEYLECTEESLQEMIDSLKKRGCGYFS